MIEISYSSPSFVAWLREKHPTEFFECLRLQNYEPITKDIVLDYVKDKQLAALKEVLNQNDI